MTELATVAALFVETGGVYFDAPGVDPWDEERDARLYDGPYPVVAHPPCARWSRLAGFTEARFGLKRGDDGGCFEAALNAVRTYGGVLEHPCYSQAFAHFGLPKPTDRIGWTTTIDDEAVCYVEQGRYGLPVKKATWLYAYGVDLNALRWGYLRDGDGDTPNGEHGGMDAWRDRFARRLEQDTPPAAHPRALAPYWRTHRHDGMRSRTPIDFRDALLEIARTSRLSTLEPRTRTLHACAT